MKKIAAFICFVCLTLELNAQVPFLQWVKQLEGNSVGKGSCIKVNALGSVFTVGDFDGNFDLDPGPGTDIVTSNHNNFDAFISKLDSSGNYIWGKRIDGDYEVRMRSMQMDVVGNIYATGYFNGTADFDPGIGSFSLNTSSYNDYEIFVLKLDPSGNFIWAKQVGGVGGSAYSYSIGIDPLNNLYITGDFSDTVDFDPSAAVFNLTTSGAFVLKLDSAGSFMWAKKMSGAFGKSITLDGTGNTYSTGTFKDTVDFDPGPSIFNLISVGNNDFFISKLDALGNFVWAKRIGGPNYDGSKSISIDVTGNLFIVGGFGDTVDFDPGPAIFNLSAVNAAVFILKLNPLGDLIWAKNFGGTAGLDPSFIAVDNAGNVYTTGAFYDGQVDFDPGVGTFILTSTGGYFDNIFISKLDPSGNFAWAKSIGPAAAGIGNLGYGLSIDINSFGNIYISGKFSGTLDFNPDAGFNNVIAAGIENAYILKFSQSGVAITENENKNTFTIYPNPSNGLFIIELPTKAEIIVTNTLSEVVFNQTLGAGKQSLSLQNQANGIYFVKVISDGKQQVSKLLKEE